MTEVYYQDEYVTLYHGDCLEHPEWWTGADVLVTDPPYGMDLHSGRGGDFDSLRIAGDDSPHSRDAALDLWDQRPSIVFGRWSVSKPSGTKAVLTWEKGNQTGMGNLNLPWRPSTEEIYVSGRWPARPNLGRGGGGRVSPVLTVTATAALTKAAGRLHPTEKPVELMARLIERCPPGLVADPFAGSGSTLVAAKLLGRKAVGVELEEKYCEIAARRLSQGVLDFREWSA